MAMRASALVFLLILASAGAAQADGFDDKAKAATPLASVESMTALFWSQGVSCGTLKNDLLRRQCEGVRKQRQRRVSSQTYLVDVGAEATTVTSDAKKMSVKVSLKSCLWCEGDGPIVVGKGAHTVEAGKVVAAELKVVSKAFKKNATAQHWAAHIATRLRAQILVRVPASVERFKVAGREGYKVEVIGYRLYDPCQGDVLAASPASKKGPVSVSACKDEPAMKDSLVAKVPAIIHPDRLSTAQIKAAMKDVSKQTNACYEAYGIEGMATFKMVIAGSGKLKRAKQGGDFVGTPTGICLDKAVLAASFPRSKKKATPITYPIVLR